MQGVRTDEVSASEWRWVIIFGGLLVAFTLLPYAWALASDAPNDNWQFMGMLHAHIDAATYMAKIEQGASGQWLFTIDYSPESSPGAAINMYYIALGHLSRLLGLSPLMMFHVARLVATFFMYITLYHLGSVIWQKTRSRRLFFALTGVGAGLGWMFIVFAPDAIPYPSDLFIPESIPFYASLVNAHFPLTIALISLLAATFLRVFRPGFADVPKTGNGGATVLILTVALCIVQPQGWIPFATALGAYITLMTVMDRRLPMPQFQWAALVVLPGIPFLVYYLAVAAYNPGLRIWNQQNLTPSPSLDRYIFGFGLILLVALPGIWRAIRRFERDGDRFMLIWIVVNVVLLYAPINLQRRLAIGLILPIAFFAVRAMEDFWFERVTMRLRGALSIALIVFILPSNIFSLLLPVFGVLNPVQGIEQGILLPKDTYQAIKWLAANGQPNTVVLAQPLPTSLWVPAYTNKRVVYGHPFETLFAEQKSAEVTAWYERGEGCDTLIKTYSVRYIIIEPVGAGAARPFPGEACLQQLGLTEPRQAIGDTLIYDLR
jgi:hypothetical protein